MKIVEMILLNFINNANRIDEGITFPLSTHLNSLPDHFRGPGADRLHYEIKTVLADLAEAKQLLHQTVAEISYVASQIEETDARAAILFYRLRDICDESIKDNDDVL